jgi:hypothetical protein
MTIEVKQLVIKSTVLNDRNVNESRETSSVDLEKIRASILEECRELIAEQIGEMRER